jgi:hypothetical protein
LRAADASQRRPAVGPWITHCTAPERELPPYLEPRLKLLPGPSIHPDLSALAALPTAHEHSAAGSIEITLQKRERFANPETSAPEQHDQRAKPVTIGVVANGAHDRDDLFHGRRVGRVLLALIARWAASVVARRGRGRAAVASGVQQHGFHESSLWDWWIILLFEPERQSRHEAPGPTRLLPADRA